MVGTLTGYYQPEPAEPESRVGRDDTPPEVVNLQLLHATAKLLFEQRFC